MQVYVAQEVPPCFFESMLLSLIIATLLLPRSQPKFWLYLTSMSTMHFPNLQIIGNHTE